MCGRARDYDHWDQAEGHTGDDDSKLIAPHYQLGVTGKVTEAGTTREQKNL